MFDCGFFKVAKIVEDESYVKIDAKDILEEMERGMSFSEVFCSQLPDFCIKADINIKYMCDNKYDLPYELVEQTGLMQLCSLDG